MIKTRTALVALAIATLVVLLAIIVWRRPTERQPEPTNSPAVAVKPPPRPAPAPATTNLVDTPAAGKAFSVFNRFVALTKPYGLDGVIEQDDVIYVRQDPKGRFLLETKTHLADFIFPGGRSEPKLHHFLATQDMSNPVALPEAKQEAKNKWYQATAKWTAEEALAETQKTMQALGIGGVEWQSTNVQPFTITIKNPQGEQVTVTPFYTVELRAPHNTLRAEFRMGQSGPGRLTEWYVWPPLPK